MRGAGQARFLAQVDPGCALVGQPTIPAGRADDDVGVAVGVDVARRAHRAAKQRVLLVAALGPAGFLGQRVCTAVIDVSPPRGGGVPRRADDQVRIAVAIYIPSRGHRLAKFGPCLLARGSPVAEGADAYRRRLAVPQPGPALFAQADGVAGGTDDDVAAAVAVHVPRRGHRPAKVGVVLVSLILVGRRCAQSRPGAEIEPGSAFVALAIGIVGRADDDVGITVAVYIPGRAHRPAESGRGLVDLEMPVLVCRVAVHIVIDASR